VIILQSRDSSYLLRLLWLVSFEGYTEGLSLQAYSSVGAASSGINQLVATRMDLIPPSLALQARGGGGGVYG